MTTTGISVGTSLGKSPRVTNIGFNQDDRDKQGITRNTVVGNVEIGETSGSPINRDVTKANEVTRDDHHSTNVNVESQTIEYATNPGKLKEDLNKAKDEIKDITKALDNSIHDPGDDNRNFFGQLRETRLSETVENIAGERLKVASTQNEIKSAFEEAYSDLGYKAEIKFSTPEETPELKDKAGTAYVSSTGVHTMIININAKENSTKSGLIGTISEEGSHIINGAKGRQIETGTEEKGLESTGRATNSYFQDKYKDDKTTISMKSDGAIDTSKLDTHVGDRIFLDKNLTDSEREKLLKVFEELTGYDLDIKKDKGRKYVEECKRINDKESCAYEIDFIYIDGKKRKLSDNAEKFVKSNELVDYLIKDDSKIFVTNGKDPNKWFGGKKGSKAAAQNKVVMIDENQKISPFVWDKLKSMTIVEANQKLYITVGHELIHVYRVLKGTHAYDSKGKPLWVTHYELNKAGRIMGDHWGIKELDGTYTDLAALGLPTEGSAKYGKKEEYATVGIGKSTEETVKNEFIFYGKYLGPGLTGEYNSAGDITENMLRKEHGLLLRSRYYRY
ncbi:M91 family zinc metallopeptidase [Leptotrichia sp. oral taxon 847]|uniref:M91 family zinc metallopeptidase n=1 Tax=Leptotrichia sp. oral taxon 847 TaxID=1785996 RepID=UPI000767ED78|nr:M91 family zinc metallopeptidase [Leptotrichia sp. oral taxon 847]AMD95693.1 hypothetical protein AXF11_08960 [Leptotrichia sp. oral taxon 847]